MFKATIVACVFVFLCENEAARILAYYPSPSISHQVVFRPLTLELVKRGHEVVVITTDPIYPNKDGPANLKEIDLHEMSYERWKKILMEWKDKPDRGLENLAKFTVNLVEEQLNTDEVQTLFKDKTVTFDLVIVEAVVEVALGLAHIYKTPVIQFSSLPPTIPSLKVFGAPIHSFVYPNAFHERVYNLTAWEKINELYEDYKYEQIIPNNLDLYNGMLKRVYGPSVPSIEELKANVDLLFLGVKSLWDNNRPLPPNVVYLGGLHQNPQKDLPKDLQSYLDSSKNGVIYVSFGTNVDPAMFPPATIQAFINVFSKMPYDVLWKWNHDELPGRTKNIKISKWLPQSDLLRHPKIKVFIMQGGLQSTDEAITAEVPLIAFPVFGDQKFNAEQYVHFGIGEQLDLMTFDEEKLTDTLTKVIQNDSYRKNVAKLHSIMIDEPMTPLERAVWWTEYVIRHKGAKHLRSPAANMSIVEYYELELIAYLVIGLLSVLSVIIYLCYLVLSSVFGKSQKIKKN